MRIIEITQLFNGSHRNQTTNILVLPEGWAVIPDDIETPNFPFGEVITKEIDGVMTVTKWLASPIPEVEDFDKPISEVERLRADIDYVAAMTGVRL